jgi:hypothetical protein
MLSETGVKNIDELKVTCRAVLRDIDWAVQGGDWTRIIRMARALKWVSDCALFSVADAERKNGRALTTQYDGEIHRDPWGVHTEEETSRPGISS